MPIELSGITFTDQGDLVPESGEEEILNNGFANTFAGNDLIVGNSESSYSDNSISSNGNRISGVYNSGTLNTDDGNDLIIGTGKHTNFVLGSRQNIISGIHNIGTLNTGDGNDEILGIRAYETDETLNNDFLVMAFTTREALLIRVRGTTESLALVRVLQAKESPFTFRVPLLMRRVAP